MGEMWLKVMHIVRAMVTLDTDPESQTKPGINNTKYMMYLFVIFIILKILVFDVYMKNYSDCNVFIYTLIYL
jgi:hypothetical protein